MPIIPETLRALREKCGLSQQRLADRSEEIEGAKVSKRTIARIENGEIRPEKVRAHTLESLAKALDVKPDDLCKEMIEFSDADWKQYGYTPLKLLIRSDVRSNYRRVAHHYGVSPKDLIDAAPWMFTLLAEMSLADRRRKLTEAQAAFEEAMASLPDHLFHGNAARTDFENAYHDEQSSLSRRDVFGQVVLETDSVLDPFDPDETNPFCDFLRRTAETVDCKSIDPEHIELPYGGGLPNWPVFETWLDELTGGDSWARFAVENVKDIVRQIPDELCGEVNTERRIDWLIRQIPPELRREEEERREKWNAEVRLEGLA